MLMEEWESRLPVESVLRVRYAETDQMGHSYYANYFVWFEVGRTDYCRACGFTYAQMEEETGSLLPVVEAQCQFRSPLKYDSKFVVKTWLVQLRSRTLLFRYQLVGSDGGQLYAEGYTKHVITDASGRPRTIPPSYRALLTERMGKKNL